LIKDDDMDSAISNSDLAFLLCGIIVTLSALFVWAIQTVERSTVMLRIQQTARRRLR
jgi:hypothetical protein